MSSFPLKIKGNAFKYVLLHRTLSDKVEWERGGERGGSSCERIMSSAGVEGTHAKHTSDAHVMNGPSFFWKNVDEWHQCCISGSFLCSGQFFTWGPLNTLLLEIPLLAGEQHIKNVHLTQLSAPRSAGSAPCGS